MTERNSILVLDDDADVRELLSDYFADQGYQVAALATGEAMRKALDDQVPDVVLLDIGLPGEDGLSLARYLREHFDVGIIMVSGAGDTVDRIVGLEVGADDYVAKPFDLRELHARVKSVIRRYMRQDSGAAAPVAGEAQPAPNTVRFGVGLLDLERCALRGENGSEIPLTAMEFGLLKVFAERPNRPLSRDQLLNLTQHRDWDPYDRSVDIRIARLRRKVEPDPRNPVFIRTVRGMGYMFVPGEPKPVD
jgi:two-component system phosphate regulon response regulator OmpR